MSLRHLAIRTTLRTLFRPTASTLVPPRLQRVLIDAAARTMPLPRGLRVTDGTLAGRPARRLDPAGAGDGSVLLYLHGGAYVVGSPRSHTPLAGQLAQAAGMRAWALDYRLAPEHPYPAAVEDAVAAYRALRDAGAGRVVLAGDSAGGGLALATALAIRDTGLPAPAALALMSPWTDLTLSGASVLARFDREPMINPPWLDWAAGCYAATTSRDTPGVSPLFADLAGLPPLAIHVGSEEVLLDDALRLARRAHAAGVAVSLREFDGLWHVFQAQAGLIPEADASLRELGDFLRRS